MQHFPRLVSPAAILAACLALLVALVSAVSGLSAKPASAGADPREPYGVLEEVSSPTGGHVRFRGWAVDPERPDESVGVALTYGPKFIGYALADEYRPDAGAAVDGYGDWHGFDGLTIGWPYFSSGTVTLCARIANYGISLGCHEVTVAPDISPPDTLLTVVPPARGTSREVRLEFAASEPPQRYECQWNEEPLTWCTSPVVRTVALGRHTVTVAAVDYADNADPTPATTTFLVEAPRLDVRVAPARRRTRVEVDLGPDSADRDYRFRVQRREDARWRTIRRTTTRGSLDVRVLDLPRGRYRVVVPDQHGMIGETVRVRLRD